MLEKNEFYIKSSNNTNDLRVIEWKPIAPIRAILQISHGMIEHIERYDEFATYLTNKGILVIGNDHLAHGKSVSDADELGYFPAHDPSQTVVKDLHKITLHTKSLYPDVPYFLLGHSMGSFMARRYLMTYGAELDGAIIMGTGKQPTISLTLGKSLVQFISLFKPMTYRSELVEKLCFGLYNRRFKPHRTKNDWLSRDPQVVDTYMQDPLCSFCFTLNGYLTLFNTLSFIQNPTHIQCIPKDLPILMVSGDADPVGNYGKGVKSIYETYKSAGISDIRLKFYKDARHEILNELDHKQVFSDISTWLNKHLPGDSH